MARMKLLTNSRMYKSKIRAVKKAAATNVACVGLSKIGEYERPCNVTGIAQHTGLKGNLSTVEIRIGISERGKFPTWSYCEQRSVEKESRIALTSGAV